MNTRRYFGKNVLRLAVALLWASTLAGCKGYKQIPEGTLAEIFRDMYILNAYVDKHALRQSLDSIDIYEPVLQSYGYTTKDFKNTIVDESKRKSFRLTDIVDRAIAMLESEQQAVQERVRRIDYIDSLALAVSTREIYRHDSTITIRSKADSLNRRLAIPLTDRRYSGRLEISYIYSLDSLDPNQNLTNRHIVIDSAGNQRHNTTARLQKRQNARYSTSVTVTEGSDTLLMTFGNYPSDAKRMGLSIDSLVVKYQPVLAEAYEVLADEYSYRLIIDEKEVHEYYAPAENSRSLYLLSPLAVEECDSDMVE